MASTEDIRTHPTATALEGIAAIEIVAAVIVGFACGQQSVSLGVAIFVSGIITATFLWAFARVVDHLHAAVQRLRNIESILKRDREHKDQS